MALCQRTVVNAGTKPTARVASAFSRRSAVIVRAFQQQDASVATRRQVAQVALAAALAFSAAPAKAFLGFGEGKEREEEYTKSTGGVLAQARGAIDLAKDDPDRDEKIKAVRGSINGWVARYRRDQQFSGRPSFSNTYSALNALAGHYNSFGSQAAIPKKRLERLVKELDDAEKLLGRGR